MTTNHRLAFFSLFARVGRYSFVFALTMLMTLGGASTAFAAVRTSTATGGNWATASTWIGGVVPANADSVIIATTGGNNVTISANKTNAGLTVNSGAILNFAGAFTLTENGNVVVNGSITGTSGILKSNSAGKTIDGSGVIDTSILVTQNFSFSSTANITINNNINSPGKTVTNNGTVTLNGNYARTSGTAIWVQGASSVLNINGAFTPSANVTLTATGAGNTINYNGSAQAIEPASYVNLTLSGSGAATMVTGTSVSGTMSIAPTGSVTASVGAGLTLTVANLTLGGLGRINGTWGSTSSTATHQNNTYFAATTGMLSVTNDTRATPTLSVTNSPVTYNGSGQAATVSGSVPGTASNILTGGVATQTNVGTYAVTANFTPTDTTSYKSLTGASAGNFVINTANQTITFGALSDKTLSDPDFAVSATASSGLTVTFSSQTTGVCTVSTATVHLVSTGTCTIRASQSGNSNYNAAADVDQSFTVTAGTLDHFAIAAIGTQTAGTAFNITITAQDVNNNTLASYSGTVDLSTTAGTIAPTQSSAFSSGVRTESVTVTQAGTLQTITATDNGGTKTGTSSTFTVNPGALDHFSFAAITTQAAGTPFNITIMAQDVNNNTVTGYSGTVDLSTTAGTIAPTESGAFVSGERTESVTVTTAGSGKTITATDNGGTKTGTSAAFTVTGGVVTSFSLNNPGDMYARTRLGYTVSRNDFSGNAVGTGTNRVYLYSNSSSGTKKFYDDSLAGSEITYIDIAPGYSTANFWYYDETPGTYTITASDATPNADGNTGIADATDSVVVNPVATKFVILPPTNGTVDASITVTVQAQKPDNSVDTNYQNDVTLDTTGSATGGGLVDIINGVGTLSISDTVAETVDLSLTDSQSTGLDVSSTQSVVFAGGTVSQFTLNHPATLAAGERAAYTITRKDQYGNVSSLGSNVVYLYSSSTGVNKKFYNAAINGTEITSITISDGQSTADVWYYDELPGTWTVTASDNISAPDGNTGINDATDSLVVTAGSVASFSLNNPGDMTADTRLGYTVTRKDQFNNLVTDGATTVYMYSNSTGVDTPAFYDADTNGTVITSITIPDGQSSAQVWYADSNLGTWTVTASDNPSVPDGLSGVADATDSVGVTAAPIVATRIVILPPTSGTVDAPITVTVQAQDNSGNVDTTQNIGVTLNTSGTATGGGLVTIASGVGTIPISDTVPEVVTLSLVDSQTTNLNVSSTQGVTFAAGAVAQFALNNPGDVAAGARIGYTVSRKDQYGNLVTAGATTAYLYSTSDGVNKKFYDAASGGSAITSIVIPDGVSAISFWAYDEKAGDWYITVSDSSSAPDSAGVADASDAITIQPAAVAKFLLNDPGNMTVSTRLGYTVTREDQFNNPTTAGVTLAYLCSSSTGTTTAFYSAAVGGAPTAFATINDGNSSGDFWYYDAEPGTWLVTASDSSGAPNGSTGILDAVDSVTVSTIPIVATRFVILPPSTVQVGTPATVTIEAQDNSGNVDTTIQSGVTLLVTGSATGAGLVTMVNGVGTASLQDTSPETVTLSLSDSEGTNLDVSSTQEITFSATPVAPSSGVSATAVAPGITIVIGEQLSGLAFPGAKIQVLSVSPKGSILQAQTTAAANGAFSMLLKNIQVGLGSYGVVGIDSLGRTTQTVVFNAGYSGNNPVIHLDAGLLSPTLGLVHPTVRQNDVVGFVGMAIPGYSVEAEIDGTSIPTETPVESDGSYKMLLPTGTLALGSHTVRVRQISPIGAKSDYTPQKVFNVTTLLTPQTDFNQDGVINVQDWSIFLSRFSSSDTAVRILDDLNGDGKVDVTDLSIFVRTLKQ
ncbi:MAG: hypothetical protein WCT41_01535 [Candidatus Paceibacterota bacterium]